MKITIKELKQLIKEADSNKSSIHDSLASWAEEVARQIIKFKRDVFSDPVLSHPEADELLKLLRTLEPTLDTFVSLRK